MPESNRTPWVALGAGLLTHLSIGQVYAFSVLIEPLMALGQAAGQDWSTQTIGLLYGGSFMMLGLIANFMGRFVSTRPFHQLILLLLLFYPAGFLLAAFGAAHHSLALVALGLTGVGGLALGLAYISPISSLVRFFPQRSALATGVSLAAFGGGGILAAPLTAWSLQHFALDGTQGLRTTFLALAVVYSVTLGTAYLLARTLPRLAVNASTARVATNPSVSSQREWRMILLMRATFGFAVLATIGILGQSGYTLRTLFPDVTPQGAASFVGLLAFANMAGRVLFAWLVDLYAPNRVYSLLLALCGAGLLGLSVAARVGAAVPFMGLFFIVILTYGGMFSTLPGYMKSLFGPSAVSYFHGRVLLAWSPAALLSPVLIATVLRLSGTPARYDVLYVVLAIVVTTALIFNQYVVQIGTQRLHRIGERS